ncbi:ZIP family metal transporter [Thermovenabulum gondwanense]|uniref:Zinc transporter ZupT n=1 Tax=Thermovenabulum gondwanense TaxID=520767 RepID=A0A162N456_9FIRM|nr:ZIP family metal transporter [Thermovenabulum gondwanense]KYO69185.1 hypothetical protein ATZ99_00580 [Thermovenabulum gondwanense]
MENFIKIFLYSALSGFAVILGGIIGTKKLPDKVIAFVLTFGSGVLLAVISYSLMHEAYGLSGPIYTSIAFILGGFTFYTIEKLLERYVAKGTGIILGTTMDDVAESLSMGIGFATNTGKLGIVLALSIFLHNIPEGISSNYELISEGNFTKKTALVLSFLLAILDPFCALLGYYLLKDMGNLWHGMIMAFTGGSILFMTSTDMIPKANIIGNGMENLGLLVGFLTAFLISRILG